MRITTYTAGFVLCLLSLTTSADTLHGRVVGVTDGDTIKDLDADQHQEKIRLADIDTPERRQPWGQCAKQALSDLVFGKQVVVEYLKRDRWKRIIGRVYVDGIDTSADLVRGGHAWVYRKYSDDPVLLELEQQARDQRRGLWPLPESQRLPPWGWRRRR